MLNLKAISLLPLPILSKPQRIGPVTDQIPTAPHKNMMWCPSGTFVMGSNRHYPEESPARRIGVDGFWIDTTPVTNAEFAEFVTETGHITVAEIAPRAADYPDAPPCMLQAGSLVFRSQSEPVSLNDISKWWQFMRDANWRHPLGSASDLTGLANHPVVHIAHADALAFAKWANKSLPTEAEWEYAAKGGLEDTEFAWGHELTPAGRWMANTWQGKFPNENLCLDGFFDTSPVGHFEQNGYGLYDMIGNVWEWTDDWYGVQSQTTLDKKLREKSAQKNAPCCSTEKPYSGSSTAIEASMDAALPTIRIPRKVLKGGSFLCAPNYCQRYRPAARIPQPIDTSTNHVGFRCVIRCTSDSVKKT